MTKAQLLAIAQRHREDHALSAMHHPRPDTWAADAVGDRGALLEFVTEMVRTGPWSATLDEIRPALKTPGLPHLQAPGLPPLRSRAKKP